MPRRRFDNRVNLDRHRRNCSICRLSRLDEIEHDFVNWRSPSAIVEEYGLSDRSSTYRHAAALDLFAKGQRNVRAALEKIIGKVFAVEVIVGTVLAMWSGFSDRQVCCISLVRLFSKVRGERVHLLP